MSLFYSFEIILDTNSNDNTTQYEGCTLYNNTILECITSKAFKHWIRNEDVSIIHQVENVTVENWFGRTLHPLMLVGLTNLTEFIILSGNITSVAGNFPELTRLEVILGLIVLIVSRNTK